MDVAAAPALAEPLATVAEWFWTDPFDLPLARDLSLFEDDELWLFWWFWVCTDMMVSMFRGGELKEGRDKLFK